MKETYNIGYWTQLLFYRGCNQSVTLLKIIAENDNNKHLINKKIPQQWWKKIDTSKRAKIICEKFSNKVIHLLTPCMMKEK